MTRESILCKTYHSSRWSLSRGIPGAGSHPQLGLRLRPSNRNQFLFREEAALIAVRLNEDHTVQQEVPAASSQPHLSLGCERRDVRSFGCNIVQPIAIYADGRSMPGAWNRIGKDGLREGCNELLIAMGKSSILKLLQN